MRTYGSLTHPPLFHHQFCLASLGGILDQYRYNVAKIRYLLASGSISDLLSDDDDNSDVDKWTLQTQESMGECDNKSSSLCTSTDFANLLRRHWSEIPSLGIDNGDSEKKKTADERSNDIRRSISVESEKIRLHASNYVCDNEVDVDGYCEMIGTFQNELILASSNHESPATTTSSSDGNIQLSRPPGLRNLGATCYLNSQLQCLAQNLGFVHGLFTWTNVGAENSRMSKVLSNMQSILARMKYGPQSVICTNEFAAALSLENDEMQDPNEVSGNALLFILSQWTLLTLVSLIYYVPQSLLDCSSIECKNHSATHQTVDSKISSRQYFVGHLHTLRHVTSVMGVLRERRRLWNYPFQL